MTGALGEQAAVAYLERKGYRIAARNYRAPVGRGEIDVIAWERDDLLVFVEVKTRQGDGFCGPTRAVTARKMDLVSKANHI